MLKEGGEDLLVVRAQAGDHQAWERLISDCFPLVHNVIGQALGGHADVDDVVQETFLQAINGLDGLRDPSRFRSWLVTIALNQVRRHCSRRKQTTMESLDVADEIPDPAADFTGLSILRLGLSGQCREIAEATRWLDQDDRELLALWWLEAAGHLTRAELTAALERPQHVAVRVQRMKEQLDAGRAIVRALKANPPCARLSELTTRWDGQPASIWRKRIARHIRDCHACSRHRSSLVPPEALLAGLILIPPPHPASVPLPHRCENQQPRDRAPLPPQHRKLPRPRTRVHSRGSADVPGSASSNRSSAW